MRKTMAMVQKRLAALIRRRGPKKFFAELGTVLILFLLPLLVVIGILGNSAGSKKNEKNPLSEDSSSKSSQPNTEIDPLNFVNAEMKNNTDLTRWAELAYQNHWGYVLGTFGQILDENLLEYKLVQYPNSVPGDESLIRKTWMSGRVADCVGLIKGYVWYNADTGTIDYGACGLPDVDAGGMYRLASVKGTINTMPDIPGLAVYIMGKHIGIYVGNGEVIHAMDTAHGVVKSKLSAGSWTHWLQVPGIEYFN